MTYEDAVQDVRTMINDDDFGPECFVGIEAVLNALKANLRIKQECQELKEASKSFPNYR